MQNFLTVAQQVVVLFVLIGAGFMLGKTKIMNEQGAKICSDIALLLATPCVIIRSFQRESNATLWWGVLAALGASLMIHLLGIGVSYLFFRGDTDRNRVFRIATVLSNAGFMGLPLQQALLGDTGVFYGAAYVAMINLTLWSFGLLTMDKQTRKLSWKKLLLSPGVVGLAVGLVVLLLPIDLPIVIAAPIDHLASLNTPLPMLFIGYYLSKVDFATALRKPSLFYACGVRLIVVPVLSAAVLYLLGIRGDLLIAMAIAASAPMAAAVSMFATRYQGDAETAVNLVALSTIFSLITMPTIVTLVQAIA